jgi:hypothetical protein
MRRGNYETVKNILTDNPKTTKRQIMDMVGCGDLQASAWMQRFKAEQHYKRGNGDPFDGRYLGGQPRRVSK